MTSALSRAAHEANARSMALSQALRQSRSAFSLAPFDIESSEAIVEAIDALIAARIRERDEAWAFVIQETLKIYEAASE
ncbi:hypothetical protein [Methylobacterium sp. WL120]|uniref:hypothetical protein n=1 Tax=Methylobacterium sp. WL120 TaxID=2603887 RepID=UPI0011C9D5AE|nr:hypothetical protein [Methylobacterium sp. WL120]TXM68315.1 hypothetical protein FV229_08065 [Methylobacterium sp. WL120]